MKAKDSFFTNGLSGGYATISYSSIMGKFDSNSNNDFDLLIIGGGAAGIFGAICAAENSRTNKPLRIAVLEKSDHFLAKVRISGGGRCNLTHSCFDPDELIKHYPRGSRELLGPFHYFQPKDTVRWFEKNGVPLKTEEDGRIFPVSNRSQSVIDCLLSRANALGIELMTRSGVQAIKYNSKKDGLFRIDCTNGVKYNSNLALLAPGGGSQSAYGLAHQLGHEIIPPVPSLFTFNIQDARLYDLAGISVEDVELNLQVLNITNEGPKLLQSRGPVLITHKGLSGPSVLKLSAWGARTLATSRYKAHLLMNWVPQFSRDALTKEFKNHRISKGRSQIINACPVTILPQRLWKKLSSAVLQTTRTTHSDHGNIDWQNASNHLIDALVDQLTSCKFIIQGRNIHKEEFVTAGGVSLKEINFRTMESRIRPGLYFAGEYIDIDGLTGGFNFQSAWTTGWLAGTAAVSKFGK